MSKRKLLIQEVFRKAAQESEKDTKSGLAFYLWGQLEEKIDFKISEKTLIRYYEAFIENNGDINIEPYKLNKLSEYLNYKDFADFSKTFIKNNDDANKTTVKISVDQDEDSLSEIFSKLVINITNEQHFKVPEFLKQNGLGIMEIVLLISLVTGNVFFSSNKKVSQLGLMSGFSSIPLMECMYWDGSEYQLADCKDRNPHLNLKPLDTVRMKYFKRITRVDTLTMENALGKTWYSKYYGNVEFFTNDGVDPNNGRELRKSTPFIIDKYAGSQEDLTVVEE